MLARKASCSVESTNSAKSGNSVLGNAQSCEFEADTSSMKQNSPGYVPPGVIVALEKRPTVHLLAENETIVTRASDHGMSDQLPIAPCSRNYPATFLMSGSDR